MTQVIKVSKAGINVGTATDPNSFIFDSTLNTFKIVATGTVLGTISAGGLGNTGTVSTAHGLSFIPPVVGFIRTTSSAGTTILHPTAEEQISADHIFRSIWADGTNVNFEIRVASDISGTVFNCRYYAFEVPL